MKNELFAIIFAGTTAALPASFSPPTAVAADAASADHASADSLTLWIAVHAPKETRPVWVGDDLAERFADRVARALRQQGFKGTIGTLRPAVVPAPKELILEVHLRDWEVQAGIADCTFRASLRTSQGSRDLGLFCGDEMIVTADGQHRVSDRGLQEAATYALADLYGRMEATGLLPSI
jgi:hypothetical protein